MGLIVCLICHKMNEFFQILSIINYKCLLLKVAKGNTGLKAVISKFV